MWKLARRNLTHDRVKFAVAAIGMTISVWLVLVQVGLYLGFARDITEIVNRSTADLWVTGEGTRSFELAAPIDARMRYVVASVPGVEMTELLILSFGQVRLSDGGSQNVEVVGLSANGQFLRPWGLAEGDAERLSEVGAVVLDRGELPKLQLAGLGDRGEINGAQFKVVGLTEGIRSFAGSPLLFTDLPSARAFTLMPESQANFVLVKATPGVDIEVLKQRLSSLPYVDAYTTAEFSEKTRQYWENLTGIGSTLFITASMGVLVGLVVVGQILYNSTLDHLKEYGTLKAIGAKNSFIVRTIIYQALLAAVIGFVAGSLLAFAASAGLRAKNLTVVLSPGLLFWVAVLTGLMSVAASLLSIVKVLRLDPAMVFKG